MVDFTGVRFFDAALPFQVCIAEVKRPFHSCNGTKLAKRPVLAPFWGYFNDAVILQCS